MFGVSAARFFQVGRSSMLARQFRSRQATPEIMSTELRLTNSDWKQLRKILLTPAHRPAADVLGSAEDHWPPRFARQERVAFRVSRHACASEVAL